MDSVLKKHRSLLQVIIQAVIWVIIFGLPVFFTYDSGTKAKIDHLLRFIWPMFFSMGLYYVNYGYIIGKFLFERKTWKFFLVNLVLLVVSLLLLQWEHEKFVAPLISKHGGPPPPAIEIIVFLRNLVTLILFIGLSVAIKMTGHWYQTESQRRMLEKMQVETELIQLKSQLNPHFLFNTLNNIYALIAISQENAQDAVHRLSKLIRYILYESEGEKVPLSKEIDFLTNYIELMSLRLPRHMKPTVHIPKPEREYFVAPLLLMPLVENAFKHSVSHSVDSFISINLHIKDGTLELLVENSCAPENESNESGSGIGLNNLRKRLELIYPGQYSFTSRLKDENVYQSLLIISL